MMQMRPMGGDGPGYAPYRDIAHCFPRLVRVAIDGLMDAEWQKLFGPFLEQHGVKEEDYVRAVTAYVEYIKNCLRPEIKTPIEALDQAGFMDIPAPVRMAITAKIGEAVTTFYHTCAREAYRIDEPQVGLDDLMRRAEAATATLNQRAQES